MPRFYPINGVYLSTEKLVEEGVGRTTPHDYDLYLVQTREGRGFELVAKYGNRPDQQYWGYQHSFGDLKCLTLARQIAQARGLIQYDVYAALDILVHNQENVQEVSDCKKQALEELVAQINSSAEVAAFQSFRQRDFQRTSEYLKYLLDDAHARGVQGPLNHKLRIILNNVLRLTTVAFTLQGIEVNTPNVVKALSFRATRFVM